MRKDVFFEIEIHVSHNYYRGLKEREFGWYTKVDAFEISIQQVFEFGEKIIP